jgi:hypothetical protein
MLFKRDFLPAWPLASCLARNILLLQKAHLTGQCKCIGFLENQVSFWTFKLMYVIGKKWMKIRCKNMTALKKKMPFFLNFS